MRYYIFLWFLLSIIPVYAGTVITAAEMPLANQDKKRITEILRRENYKIIEPFFFVSNRPTLQEALSDQIRDGILTSPENHMVYCPPEIDYYTAESLGNGTIYIDSQNLPKNGHETARWFQKAYGYRTANDPNTKPANVTIITAKKRNFLHVKCPNSENQIIVSSAPAPYSERRPRLVIKTAKDLSLTPEDDISWDSKDFTLPSTIRKDFITSTEMKIGNLPPLEINPSEDYLKIARIVAEEQKIFVKLLLAIAEVASDYKADKIGRIIAEVEYGEEQPNESGTILKLGITQIAVRVAEKYKYSEEKLFDPAINFKLCAMYFKDLYKMFSSNLEKTLQAYYMGILTREDENKIQTAEAQIFAKEVMRRLTKNQPLVFENTSE